MKDDPAALTKRFMEAARDGELAWLEEHLGAEFTLTTGRAGAPVRSRSEWLRITAESYTIEDFALDDVDTHDHGLAALVRCLYRQHGSMAGARRDRTYLMTDVWIERDGRPQLVTRHVSPLQG